ncbi:hypothetical protein ACS0TY_029452 [Phlomoides rotata]
MASSFLFFLLSCTVIAAVSAQIRGSNITLGSSLTPSSNSSWLSPSGLFAFGFFPQNTAAYAVGVFLPGAPYKTVVWTANWNNPTVSNDVVLQLTRDGRLVLQRGGQNTIYVANPPQSIASASMLDNGNFVLYNSESSVIWQSFDYPTDTLLQGQRLAPGSGLFSSASETDHSKGVFTLQMQTDGNLVQYPASIYTPQTAYYATATNGEGTSNVSLNLDNNGRLYLLNSTSFMMNITIGGYTAERSIYLLRLDVGGIFRLYSRPLNPRGNWTTRWVSTNVQCAPKGLCGLNAFCVQNDDVPDCKCLPGFDFVQSGNWSAGCERGFRVERCGKRESHGMIPVENTVWLDNSYEVLDAVTEQDCGKACLDDCNCEAAFLKNGKCSKQMLPLRFGRRVLSDSNVALVRVTSDDQSGEGVVTNWKIKKVTRVDILAISISLMVVGTVALLLCAIYVGRKGRNYKKIAESGEANLVSDVGLRAFSYAELTEATNDFAQELGRGASGTVYKGVLSSTRLVAVKRLQKEVSEGEREFHTEMKTIGRTYHRNLVRLLGYCLEGAHKLLVLEYMSNGSLASMLFHPEKRPSWEERIKVARDIARGILYLHQECETQIIHCDIKPQNILMDDNWCAKISDFGLAKLLKQDQTNTYTGIRGTKGYVAPEWHQKQAVTVKADVYSFGIVLLEIVCCRRSVDCNLCEDEAILEDWVYMCYAAGEVGKLVGNERVDARKLERMVMVGIWCIQYEPALRPSMNKVVLMLEGTVEIPIPPSPTSFLSSY